MIDFDEATHTYRVGGQVRPSVTQILRPIVDFSAVPPGVLQAKSDLGVRVHRATELDDADDLEESSVGDDVRPYLQAWRDYLRDTGAVVLLSEGRVYNPGANYCGTLDRVLDIDGAEWLVDIKTSAQVHRAVGPQTAAYEQALGWRGPLRRGVVQLRPDGSYRFRELHDPRDWVIFQACNLIFRTNQENPYV